MTDARPAILCWVTDRAGAGDDPERSAAAAVQSGVDWIQIRDRGLSGRELLDFADRVSRAARTAAKACGRHVRIVVNRRADVAMAIGADGVHLGYDAMDPATARRLLGRNALVGVSAHAAPEVARAAREGCSYAHLAPVFPPLSKSASRAPLGATSLRAAAACGIPVLAQGGIDAGNAAAVRAAGAAGAAVTGAVSGAADPEAAVRALRASLDGEARCCAAPRSRRRPSPSP